MGDGFGGLLVACLVLLGWVSHPTGSFCSICVASSSTSYANADSLAAMVHVVSHRMPVDSEVLWWKVLLTTQVQHGRDTWSLG